MSSNSTNSHNNSNNSNNNNISPQQFHNNNNYYSGRSSFSQTPTTAASLYPDTADSDAYLDIDSEIKSQASTSSSPHSVAGSFPLSTFDGSSAAKFGRTLPSGLSFNLTSPVTQQYQLPGSLGNMMYADVWAGDVNQFASKNNSRSAHNRDSSLSSLGSLGPASPFSYHSSNPQIAVTDSSDYHGMPMISEDHSYQLTAKVPNATSHDTFYANYPLSDNTSVQDYASMLAPQKHRGERVAPGGLLPPSGSSNGGSRPGSVASSEASDSPATPAALEPAGEQERRRKIGEDLLLSQLLDYYMDTPDSHFLAEAAAATVPKLDRTMTDIFGDELYNPNFDTVSASAPSQPSQSVASPTNEMFARALQAANSQHLTTTAPAPALSIHRGRSPFRNGSPLAPKPMQDFSPQVSSNMRFNTAQSMRERRKHEDTAQALRQITQTTSAGTPQTISPKDAILEYNEDDSSNNFSLFPQQQSSGYASQMGKVTAQPNNFNNLALDTNFDSYLSAQLSASQLSNNSVQMPQQYPFVSKQTQQPSLPSATSFSMSTRMESSASPSSNASSPQRPEHIGADGGTYTCTYHGCTQRFETPALLQKHKREGHRQAHGANGLRRPELSPITSGNYFNTQAGPHKCERINPSTGKPCNTIFSRPYDLTRHEDTIHNGRKQKVRCDVCTEEKTFSRADALTRHYRVCHPDLEFPGKHRKRGGSTT